MEDIKLHNKEQVYAYFEAMTRSDNKAAAAIFAEDGVILSQSRTELPPEIRGRSEVEKVAGQIIDAFPNGLKMVVHSTTAEDDRVSAEVESWGFIPLGRITTTSIISC